MKKITMREAIREALMEEMAIDPDVILIGEDIGYYGGTLQVTAGIWDKFGSDRVLDTPVGRHRPAGPYRASLVGGLVAYREHEIQMRRIGPRKLVPVLAAQAFGADPVALQQLKRAGADLPCRLAAGTEGPEAALADFVQDGFGEDAAGRVAGAEKKHVV